MRLCQGPTASGGRQPARALLRTLLVLIAHSALPSSLASLALLALLFFSRRNDDAARHRLPLSLAPGPAGVDGLAKLDLLQLYAREKTDFPNCKRIYEIRDNGRERYHS